MKNILICIFTMLFVGLSSNSAFAGTVTQVKESRILLSGELGEYQVGENITIVNLNNEKIGEGRVTQVKKTKAIAEISSGSAAVGMTAFSVYRRPPETGGTHQYNLFFEPSGAGFSYKLSNSFSIGLELQGASVNQQTGTLYSVTTTAVAIGIFNGRISWLVEARGFADTFYFAFDLGQVEVDVSRTTGIATPYKGRASSVTYGLALGYHWFWQNFNLRLGLKSMNLGIKELSISNGTLTETYTGLPATVTGLELGLGYAF